MSLKRGDPVELMVAVPRNGTLTGEWIPVAVDHVGERTITLVDANFKRYQRDLLNGLPDPYTVRVKTYPERIAG